MLNIIKVSPYRKASVNGSKIQRAFFMPIRFVGDIYIESRFYI